MWSKGGNHGNTMEYDGNPMEPYGRLHYEILWHTTTMEYYEILEMLSHTQTANTIEYN
jgi:hypothetical protein